jgi:hypothetical protein
MQSGYPKGKKGKGRLNERFAINGSDKSCAYFCLFESSLRWRCWKDAGTSTRQQPCLPAWVETVKPVTGFFGSRPPGQTACHWECLPLEIMLHIPYSLFIL